MRRTTLSIGLALLAACGGDEGPFDPATVDLDGRWRFTITWPATRPADLVEVTCEVEFDIVLAPIESEDPQFAGVLAGPVADDTMGRCGEAPPFQWEFIYDDIYVWRDGASVFYGFSWYAIPFATGEPITPRVITGEYHGVVGGTFTARRR